MGANNDVPLNTSNSVCTAFTLRIFSNLQLFLSNSTANPEKINPLSRVEKNKSETNPITCGRVNPDILESDDVKSVSTLTEQ